MTQHMPPWFPPLCAFLACIVSGITSFGDGICFLLLVSLASAAGIIPNDKDTYPTAVLYVTLLPLASLPALLWAGRKELKRSAGYASLLSISTAALIPIGSKLLLTGSLHVIKTVIGSFFICFACFSLWVAMYGLGKERSAAGKPLPACWLRIVRALTCGRFGASIAAKSERAPLLANSSGSATFPASAAVNPSASASAAADAPTAFQAQAASAASPPFAPSRSSPDDEEGGLVIAPSIRSTSLSEGGAGPSGAIAASDFPGDGPSVSGFLKTVASTASLVSVIDGVDITKDDAERAREVERRAAKAARKARMAAKAAAASAGSGSGAPTSSASAPAKGRLRGGSAASVASTAAGRRDSSESATFGVGLGLELGDFSAYGTGSAAGHAEALGSGAAAMPRPLQAGKRDREAAGQSTAAGDPAASAALEPVKLQSVTFFQAATGTTADSAGTTTPVSPAEELTRTQRAVRCLFPDASDRCSPLAIGIVLFFTGFASGLMAGLVGSGGPPQLIAFAQLRLRKEWIRGVKLLATTVSNLIRITLFAVWGSDIFKEAWYVYLAVALASLTGATIGSYLRQWVAGETILRLLYVLLFLSTGELFGALEDPAGISMFAVATVAWLVSVGLIYLYPGPIGAACSRTKRAVACGRC